MIQMCMKKRSRKNGFRSSGEIKYAGGGETQVKIINSILGVFLCNEEEGIEIEDIMNQVFFMDG